MSESTPLSIYCSGSIVKGAVDTKKLCWSEIERSSVALGCSPRELVFLSPDDPIPAGSSTLAQFGRDLYQVMTATAVVVDARERRGIGIGVEMAAASALGTPLIVVAPRNSNYRQDKLAYRESVILDYIHPHIASLATAVVNDFEQAGATLLNLPAIVRRREMVPPWLEPAIMEYERTALHGDPPMVAAMQRLGLWGR